MVENWIFFSCQVIIAQVENNKSSENFNLIYQFIEIAQDF